MTGKFILVVGGAGYIGSHMTIALQERGYIPIILDNLSTGHAASVLNAPLIVGNMDDSSLLSNLFASYPIQAVLHVASFIQIQESITSPLKYYQNNIAATLGLLEQLLKHRIRHFIFSSSAAVYGEPLYNPIDEDHRIAPINPYGHSKQMLEQMLIDFSHAYDFKFVALRYFNAAGADPLGRLCENHHPETHLIPLVLQAAQRNQPFTIYGNDYATLDGTCVRDFIHVNDLCDAHLSALSFLTMNNVSRIYNLGAGKGYSVKQVIDMASHILGKKIKVNIAKRRAGDPAILIANAKRAKIELAFEPKFSDLETIITHAAYVVNANADAVNS